MNFRIIVFAAGVILLVVGTALAQGLGLGSGMDDGRRLARRTMRRTLAVAALLVMAAPAWAADIPAPSPPLPQQLTINITPADLSMMAQALGARPFNEVVQLMNKLHEQVDAQSKPKPAEKK